MDGLESISVPYLLKDVFSKPNATYKIIERRKIN